MENSYKLDKEIAKNAAEREALLRSEEKKRIDGFLMKLEEEIGKAPRNENKDSEENVFSRRLLKWSLGFDPDDGDIEDNDLIFAITKKREKAGVLGKESKVDQAELLEKEKKIAAEWWDAYMKRKKEFPGKSDDATPEGRDANREAFRELIQRLGLVDPLAGDVPARDLPPSGKILEAVDKNQPKEFKLEDSKRPPKKGSEGGGGGGTKAPADPKLPFDRIDKPETMDGPDGDNEDNRAGGD